MFKNFVIPCLLAIALTSACSHPPDLDKLPAGTQVQLTRQDGGVISGTLGDVSPDHVLLHVGRRDQTVRRIDISDVRVIDNTTGADHLSDRARFRAVDVPDGVSLNVSMETATASDSNRPEDPIEAHLIEPLSIDDVTVLPAGAVLHGVVSSAVPSGKVKGRAELALHFQTIDVPDQHEHYAIDARWSREAAATKGSDAKKIGIPAAGGAILGGIFGGGKGAAIGAVVGGGAGTAVVLTTAGNEVRLPRGSTLTVSLEHGFEAHLPIK